MKTTRTLNQIKKEDPISYVILLLKGRYEGSLTYAYENWGDPAEDMEGWSSYREAAIEALEGDGSGIPGDSSENRKLQLAYKRMKK